MADVMEDVTQARPRNAELEPPAPKPRRSPMKLIILGMLAVLIVAGAWAYFHFRGRVSSDDAQVDGHIVAIAPKISGTVLQVLVNDNQQVKAGDVLVRIDPRDYEARVEQARAAVQQASSQLTTAQTSVPLTSETTTSATTGATAQLSDAQAELERARLSYENANTAQVAVAQANVRSKEASNQRAQADLARMRPLLEKAEISQQQFDAYQAQARVAESELHAAQEQLTAAQNSANIAKSQVSAAQARVNMAASNVQGTRANQRQVAVRQAETGTASAGVQAARANLAAAELQLSYATIVAPVDGVVTRKSVEPGQIVQPGQSLMTVIQPDVWVTANFKETQLATVHPGQRAEIHIDMYGKSIPGHVDSIAYATGSRLSLLPAENATGNFVKVVQRIPVKILVDRNEGLTLRPGMNVDATIFTQ